MYIKHILLNIVLILISIDCIKAQHQDTSNPWKQYIADVKAPENNVKKNYAYQLVQFDEKVTRHDLNKQGVNIIRQLDKEYAIVQSTTAIENSLVKKQWPANNNWKMGIGTNYENTSKSHQLFIKSIEEANTFNFLKNNNITVIKQLDANTFIIKATGYEITNILLPAQSIIYIGKESQTPVEESRVIDLNLNVNTVNVIHNNFPSLNGTGITASIQEQRFKSDDIDIIGRTVPSGLSAESENSHATEMATIVAGAGNSFINGKGVASAAKLTSSDFSEVLPDADTDYSNLSVSVQNHSYGTAIENFYGVEAEAFDLSANRNPQLLHVMSSGNLGLEQDTSGTYTGVNGYANLSGNFKMSKNSLLVGSVDTVGRTINFVSKGPAFDGRVKPELVTYSTVGSSNSSALVSGIIVLLQQAYKEQHGPLPSASLIKALLINSAKDVHTKAVDFLTGFGNVDAHRTLQNLTALNYFEGSIDHQQNESFNLTVPPNVENLKITIVWNDPTASPNANMALVNDLDMQVSFSGSTWQPWVLNTEADAELLAQPAIRGEDHLNNIEQITIENPAPGDYTVSIEGYDIPEGPQDFFIAYQWDNKEQFNWSFPTASDNMPYDGETGSYFRWNSTLNNTAGKLEYSTNGGDSWVLIDTGIDLRKGHYRWLPPEINSKAMARMTVDGVIFNTDNFTISRPLPIKVGFNCADSVLLQWDKLNNAVAYDVYTMGDQYLQKFVTTNDTAVVVYKNNFDTRYFSIQPNLAGNGQLIKSYTIDYDLQGNSCFLISFYSTTNDNDELFLKLELGTTYGIKNIVFERKSGSLYEELATVTPQMTSLSVQEPEPVQGLNVHRARIEFLNGEELITSETITYFLTEKAFLVFPNPLRPGDELNVYSKDFEPGKPRIFTLYNRMGQIIRQEALLSSREFIDTEGLESGLYLYKISANSEEAKGRIVVIE